VEERVLSGFRPRTPWNLARPPYLIFGGNIGEEKPNQLVCIAYEGGVPIQPESWGPVLQQRNELVYRVEGKRFLSSVSLIFVCVSISFLVVFCSGCLSYWLILFFLYLGQSDQQHCQWESGYQRGCVHSSIASRSRVSVCLISVFITWLSYLFCFILFYSDSNLVPLVSFSFISLYVMKFFLGMNYMYTSWVIYIIGFYYLSFRCQRATLKKFYAASGHSWMLFASSWTNKREGRKKTEGRI